MNEDLGWLFGFIFVVAIVWFATGGINRPSSNDPFVAPITDPNNIETYGNPSGNGSNVNNNPLANPPTDAEVQAELEKAQEQSNLSTLAGKISITRVNTTSSSGDPSREYILLQANPNNPDKIPLTGLRLHSAATGQDAIIGDGVYLPFTGSINATEPIFLGPGEIAYIISGRSPIGISFRLNNCIGFWSQNQSFNPGISSNCPRPSVDVPQSKWAVFSDACVDYIESLPGCRTVTNPPTYLQFECRDYVMNEISYNKCISHHKDDPNFYQKDWRIYLSRGSTIWKSKRETIEFLDQSGKEIQTYSY